MNFLDRGATMREANFDLGDCFCEITCVHGHSVRLFNLGRGHYAACDSCRCYIFLGSNLISSWRHETPDIWEANYNSVKGYRFVESC